MKRKYLFAILLVSIAGGTLRAENSNSAADILKRASVYGAADTLTATVQMRISTPQGVRNRTLEAYVKRTAAGSQVFIQMTAPAFLSSMKFLSKQEANGSQARWIGTSRGVRRVASEGSGEEHLFDSDFTVDDLSPINPSRFDLTMLSPASVAGQLCYVVEATPRFAGASYKHKILYVAEEGLLLMGLDYFSTGGALLRRYRTISTQMIEGDRLPKASIMSTPAENSSTQLTFERIDTERSIPDRFFNIGSM